MFVRNTQDFAARVTLGTTTESLHMEFKGDISGWNVLDRAARQRAQLETCRDIAQFANTLGGTVLIGVVEQPRSDGLKVATCIMPVPEVDTLRAWIEEAIANHLVPSTVSVEILPIRLEQGHILALNVPPSRHAVYVWDRATHKIECLRRTNHGKAWMNPDEMERHLMDGSRAAQIAFNEVLNQAKGKHVDLAGRIDGDRDAAFGAVTPSAPKWIDIGAVGDRTFELRIGYGTKSPCVNIPYGLIREIWRGPDQKICLLLSARLVLRANGDIAIMP
jgi:Putative DNA-binding domain